jgi:adenylate cyclase class 2
MVSLSNPKERFILTYKGAKEKDQFKKRQEIDIEIEDPDLMEKMLTALGYNRVLVVEKKRKTWRYRDCVVALDELPLLGVFVEIEGPDDEIIGKAQEDLWLTDLQHIPESYAGLIEQKLRTNEGRETR